MIEQLSNYLGIIAAVIIAIVAHEISHGWMAYKLGDNTAKINGRLSLNPLKHLDLFGSIILPCLLILSKIPFVFGWAKPVPVDFSQLKNYRRDIILVSAAGIITNLILAVISGIAINILQNFSVNPLTEILKSFLFPFLMVNVVLAFFNLLPIPPLDGSKIFFGWINRPWAQKYINADKIGILMVIIFFFVIPAIGNKLGLDLNFIAFYLRTCVLKTVELIFYIF